MMNFKVLKTYIQAVAALFAFYLAALPANVQGQVKNEIQFTHLTTANGLSQSSVVCILKDHYGFMWFGTQDGLNKYDGYKFKVYRNDPADKKSIPYNNIRCLLEDHAGNIWVGTAGGGLALYDRDNDCFIPISTDDSSHEKAGSKIIKAIYEDTSHHLWVCTVSDFNMLDPQTKRIKPYVFAGKPTNNITCIYEDKQTNIWVGTIEGLYFWNRTAGTFKYFGYDGSGRGLSNMVVNAISEDSNGNIVIGTNGGLNLYNLKTNAFTSLKNDAADPASLRDNVIRTIINAGDGKLWIGTEQALELFDPRKKTFTHFQQNSKNIRSLSSSSITSLLLDDQQILWVGTYAKGINKYDKNQFKFNLFKNFGTDDLNINANIVTSFSEAPNGDVWVGTDGSGLYRWNRASNKFTPYIPGNRENTFASTSILCMQLSRNKNELWIGTYDKGLAKIDLKTGAKTYYTSGNSEYNLNNRAVYAVLEDRNGNIWAGTNGGGVNILNTATHKIRQLKFKVPGNLDVGNHIRCFYEDKNGNIWIGTVAHGIIVYYPATEKYIVYNKLNSNLGSNAVFAIYGDTQNNMWAGTMGGGLRLFDARKGKFEGFTESRGLANSIVDHIVEDNKGYLWISTGKGISCLDIKHKSFKNYDSASGLQSNEFSIGSGLKLTSGEIVFGGLEGFNLFTPGHLNDNHHAPPVVITDFQLFNKTVPITTGKSPLPRNINITKQITLNYSQSVFTIEFAALGYTVPERNNYAYKLEGFDKNWNFIGTERKTTYTNLDPGEYTFRVKASNNDGLWNETGATLLIKILPPFWKTTWAYILYILVVAGLLYLVYKEITAREKLKSEVHYQKLLTGKTNELNQLKLNFFTSLSHELRTPLSLIIDPLRKLKNEEVTVEQAKKYSGLVFNNATMLINLVNQLLDFRKVETGSFTLDARKVEVISLVKNIFHAFTVRATERNIDYYLELKTDYLEAWIDTDKLEKILYNLISNAFKYTPDFGVIVIMASLGEIKDSDDEKQNALEIHIKDSGVGIPDDLKNKIFDIFYQVKGSSRFEKESSGIGLALTKELVLLHRGEINVKDSENEGTNFILKLPIGNEYFSSEGPAPNEVERIVTNVLTETQAFSVNDIDKHKDGNSSGKPIILIVEDNPNLRDYIAEELQCSYHIEQATDGVQGLQKAIELIPDLIISDIMMPGIDGLELCNRLKSDEKTSHIPIVLLTAKQTDENKIEGFNQGADDYISKPFNVNLLAVRVHNILGSRKKLRELFSGHTETSIEDSAITAIDKEFLKKVVKIIEGNLSNLNFDIDKLAVTLKMSRRQLYRKLSALTNQTAHDFITNTRLDHAAGLLITGEFTISEIGYKVGFSEPSNFSRTFTKKFGKSPKKYLSEKKQSNLQSSKTELYNNGV